jgi:ribokinase
MGVRVAAALRDEPTRRGFVHLDARGERTITVIGDRLAPCRDDSLPWQELDGMDAIYLTAGDPGAVRAARGANKLVATPRTMETLGEAGVQLDALVSSAKDAGEHYEPGDLNPPPLVVVRTEGDAGGTLVTGDGQSSRWAAAPVEGEPGDSYGAGDCFAAGFTYGLGEGLSPEEAATRGARAGAACMSGRGPYEGQIDSHRISSG